MYARLFGLALLVPASIAAVTTACPGYPTINADGTYVMTSGTTFPSGPVRVSKFPDQTSTGVYSLGWTSVVSSSQPRVMTVTFNGGCARTLTGSTTCGTTDTLTTTLTRTDFENSACFSKVIQGSNVKYSTMMGMSYQDAYTTNSGVQQFALDFTLPVSGTSTTTAGVFAADNSVLFSYRRLNLVYGAPGSLPTIEFPTLTRTNFPYNAKGQSLSFSGPAGSVSGTTPISSTETCSVYSALGVKFDNNNGWNGQCNRDTDGCYIICERTVSKAAPQCNLSGYKFDFTYAEWSKFPATGSADRTVTSSLGFEATNWNVCPSNVVADYSKYVVPSAYYGDYSVSSGVATENRVPASTVVGINQPLTFTFKLSVSDFSAADTAPTNMRFYQAALSRVTVQHGADTFTILGVAGAPLSASPARFADGTQDLPTLMGSSGLNDNQMLLYNSGKNGLVSVTFTPAVGNTGDHTMLHNGDGSTTLSVTFEGLVAIDSTTTLARRAVPFKRTVEFSANQVVIDPTELVKYHPVDNNTTSTIVIVVPNSKGRIDLLLGLAIGIPCGVLVLGMMAGGVYWMHKSRRSVKVAQSGHL